MEKTKDFPNLFYSSDNFRLESCILCDMLGLNVSTQQTGFKKRTSPYGSTHLDGQLP